MKFKESLAEGIKLFDLFSSTQFLRYKQDEDYKTISGGLTSILVVAIFSALFAGNAIATFQKTSISWQMTKQNYFDPLPSNLSTTPDSMSMFAVGIIGFDLNDPNYRYFDIQVVQISVENQIFHQIASIVLEPCTAAHFSQTQTLKNAFNQQGLNKRVCFPLDFSYELKGNFATGNLETLQIRVKQCNNSLPSSRPCVNQSVIDDVINQVGSIQSVLYYVNPLINPGNTNYLDYYLDDKNFISFTKLQGAYTMVYLEDYVIETDESLLPLSQINTDQGLNIPQVSRLNSMEIYNGIYVSYYIQKDNIKTTYKRSFNKIDELFSYVGGLIGTILGFMLFMNNFTLMSFELDLANDFFKYKENESSDFSKFNIFSYFGYLIYKAGSFCGLCKGWEQMKKKVQCKEQILKQLDVCLLLRRFSYLERAIQHLLEIQQIQMKSFGQMETLKDVKNRRKKYKKSKNRDRDSEEDDSESSSDESQSPSKQNPFSIAENKQIDYNISLQNINEPSLNQLQSFQIIDAANDSKNQQKQMKNQGSRWQKSFIDKDGIQKQRQEQVVRVFPRINEGIEEHLDQSKSDSMHFQQNIPFKK